MFRLVNRDTGSFYNFETKLWGVRDVSTLILDSHGFRSDSPYLDDVQAMWKAEMPIIEVGEFGSIEDSVRNQKFNNICASIQNGWSAQETAKLLVFFHTHPDHKMALRVPDCMDDPVYLQQLRNDVGYPKNINTELLIETVTAKNEELLQALFEELKALGASPILAPYDHLVFEDRDGMIVRLSRPDDVVSLPKYLKRFTDAGFDMDYIQFQADNSVHSLLFGKDKPNAE